MSIGTIFGALFVSNLGEALGGFWVGRYMGIAKVT
jgi:hypothetical protein